MFGYEAIIAILSLTLLEVILGIDNILFINMMVSKVPPQKRERIRKIGIALALCSRLMLLSIIGWILTLNTTLFILFKVEFSLSSLVLISGGFFLLYKAIIEIHEQIETKNNKPKKPNVPKTGFILAQIVFIDTVFSLDSIFTAIGMVNNITWMATAIILAVIIMMFISKSIAEFIEKHPSIKLLALSFLVMVGVLLVSDGFGHHFERKYVYCAMFFAIIVESLNMRLRHNLNVCSKQN
ncbi:MAG: TerC family protein [Pseudomonadota bacterium]|nr:TerC family protein [Pseudomonadota bacterium]